MASSGTEYEYCRFGGNEIGDAGLSALCDALRGSNATLVSVEMVDNRVTNEGGGAETVVFGRELAWI